MPQIWHRICEDILSQNFSWRNRTTKHKLWLHTYIVQNNVSSCQTIWISQCWVHLVKTGEERESFIYLQWMPRMCSSLIWLISIQGTQRKASDTNLHLFSYSCTKIFQVVWNWWSTLPVSRVCGPWLPDGLFSNQKKTIWVIFRVPLIRKCWYILWPMRYFMDIWYIVWPFGKFLCSFGTFFRFWYHLLKKIWHPWCGHELKVK
jgi:hypothetical protein